MDIEIQELLGLLQDWAEHDATNLKVSINLPNEFVTASELLSAANIINRSSHSLKQRGYTNLPLELSGLEFGSASIESILHHLDEIRQGVPRKALAIGILGNILASPITSAIPWPHHIPERSISISVENSSGRADHSPSQQVPGAIHARVVIKNSGHARLPDGTIIRIGIDSQADTVIVTIKLGP